MIRDDFLLRQLRLLTAALARALGRAKAAEIAEAECAAFVGLDLGVAAALSPDTLLGLLRTADGLDAERCLALGMGLGSRAARLDFPAALVATARTLIAAALAARPALDDDDVQEMLATLGVPE
ncbi:MAG: hypothetical protein V4850_27660 [Myxococcota bacterium]